MQQQVCLPPSRKNKRAKNVPLSGKICQTSLEGREEREEDDGVWFDKLSLLVRVLTLSER